MSKYVFPTFLTQRNVLTIKITGNMRFILNFEFRETFSKY